MIALTKSLVAISGWRAMPSSALEPATPIPIPGPITPTAAIPEPINEAALIMVVLSNAAVPACAMSVWSTVDLLLGLY